MGSGVVGVIEAGYSVLANDDIWLKGIAEQVVPLLGRGLGVHAYVYDLSGDDRFRTVEHVTVDADEAWRAQWSKMVDTPAGREFLHVVHKNQPRMSSLGAFMDRAGGADPFVTEMMKRSGYGDFISLNALDPGSRPSGRGRRSWAWSPLGALRP